MPWRQAHRYRHNGTHLKLGHGRLEQRGDIFERLLGKQCVLALVVHVATPGAIFAPNLKDVVQTKVSKEMLVPLPHRPLGSACALDRLVDRRFDQGRQLVAHLRTRFPFFDVQRLCLVASYLTRRNLIAVLDHVQCLHGCERVSCRNEGRNQKKKHVSGIKEREKEKNCRVRRHLDRVEGEFHNLPAATQGRGALNSQTSRHKTSNYAVMGMVRGDQNRQHPALVTASMQSKARAAKELTIRFAAFVIRCARRQRNRPQPPTRARALLGDLARADAYHLTTWLTHDDRTTPRATYYSLQYSRYTDS